MKTLITIAALAALLVTTRPVDAYVSFGFGTLRAPVIVASPYGPGVVYGAPGYYPPPYYPAPYYGYPPTYAVPVVPYGYPLGYRGAWRTDYPAWSPGPRGYRWR